MTALLAAVRFAVAATLAHALRPLCPVLSERRAVAWFVLRAAAPSVPGGRLERVVNDQVAARLARLARRLRDTSEPANDVAHHEAQAL